MAETSTTREPLSTTAPDPSSPEYDLTLPPPEPAVSRPHPAGRGQDAARRAAERADERAEAHDVARPEERSAEVVAREPASARPDSPDALRREIEATRERMSRTVDEIEARLLNEKRALVRTKDRVWAVATLKGFRRKVSEEPFRSMAIAFAAGYIIAAIRD